MVAEEQDRQLARELARFTQQTILMISGKLEGEKCLPVNCEGLCPSFKLLSMRQISDRTYAMFSVPAEAEMADLFDRIDGRTGIRAMAFDRSGQTKDAYVI